MKNTPDDIQRELAELTPGQRAEVLEYIAFLRWREARPDRQAAPSEGRAWRFSLLEHFAGADVRTTRDRAGMEVKIGEASVGKVLRPALWAHPPVSGEAVVEFHVPVPAGLRDLRLRAFIGIRDGAQTRDEQLVAFRVRVDGWQVWSRAAWPTEWEPVEVALPLQAGDVVRLALATDGLGAHRWAWAVWGEPELIGTESAGQPAGPPCVPGQLGA